MTGFRLRVESRPVLRHPPPPTATLRERVPLAKRQQLDSALAALATGAKGAATAFEALRHDDGALLSAYALLVDFLAALPAAPLGRAVDVASEGAAWRSRCASRLLVGVKGTSAAAVADDPDAEKQTSVHEWRETRGLGDPIIGRWAQAEYKVETPRTYRRFALKFKAVFGGGTIQLGRIAFRGPLGESHDFSSIAINCERCHGGGGEAYTNVQSEERRKWCA